MAIVGDNSAGFTAALACHAAGFSDITLYAPDPEAPAPPTIKADVDSTIELSPNASRVLRTLKTLDDLHEFCFEPQFVHLRSYRTGFQLSIQALGAMAEGRYNAPYLHVSRQDLKNVLRSIAERRGIRQIKAGISNLSQTAEKVNFQVQSRAQGVNRTHDVLIVAADPGDRLRAQANAEPIHRSSAGFAHWQADLSRDELPQGAFGPVVTQWLGPDHHLSYHFGKNAERLYVSALTREPAGDRNHDALEPGPKRLAKQFANWHGSIGTLLQSAENLRCTAVEESISPERLAHGRILFLAATAHSILPHLPQHAALGIEDAWVAARMLEQWEEEPSSGWIEYEKYRLPRARRLQERARRAASELCEATPSKAWMRNLGLSLSSRFLPELAMQKNDWLYGYDAVNGFE